MKVIFRSPAAVGRTSVSKAPATEAGAAAIRTSGIMKKANPFIFTSSCISQVPHFPQLGCGPVKLLALFCEIILTYRLAVNDQHKSTQVLPALNTAAFRIPCLPRKPISPVGKGATFLDHAVYSDSIL